MISKKERNWRGLKGAFLAGRYPQVSLYMVRFEWLEFNTKLGVYWRLRQRSWDQMWRQLRSMMKWSYIGFKTSLGGEWIEPQWWYVHHRSMCQTTQCQYIAASGFAASNELISYFANALVSTTHLQPLPHLPRSLLKYCLIYRFSLWMTYTLAFEIFQRPLHQSRHVWSIFWAARYSKRLLKRWDSIH